MLKYIEDMLNFFEFFLRERSCRILIGLCKQGGLNKKEIQLNLCHINSIFIFNELFFLPDDS